VDVRVLIIDDASTDDTPQVAAQLAAEDHRVDVRRHPENRGHIATYNEGLEWASGDYTMLLSADDYLVPGALARAVKVMDANPSVGFCYGRVLSEDRHCSGWSDKTQEWESWAISGREFLEWNCITAENLVASPTVVTRTDLQKRLGGYREDLPHCGDMEMWMRFAAYSSVAFINQIQACYRCHGQNMFTNYEGVLNYKQLRDAFRTLFDDHGAHIEDGETLHALAYGRLGDRAYWAAHESFDQGKSNECVDLLRLAVETNPGIASSRSFTRLRWKLSLGPLPWRLLKPLWERIRSMTQRSWKPDIEEQPSVRAFPYSWDPHQIEIATYKKMLRSTSPSGH